MSPSFPFFFRKRPEVAPLLPESCSLALGGGAARGFVHIGAYRYLRERGVGIREISGTSMGAIAAALIASGKTPDEIADFARSIRYYGLVDPDFRFGIIKGKKIEKFLRTTFSHARIEDMPIPLRIVATNLDTREAVVFDQGDVADAIRASIAIPGVFVPSVIGGHHFVDGGLTMNLPVQALSGKDVIAVSALKADFAPMRKKKKVLGVEVPTSFVRNNFEILNRSLNLLMKANEDVSATAPGKHVRLVRPNFADFDALDFDKSDEIAELGYRAMVSEFGP